MSPSNNEGLEPKTLRVLAPLTFHSHDLCEPLLCPGQHSVKGEEEESRHIQDMLTGHNTRTRVGREGWVAISAHSVLIVTSDPTFPLWRLITFPLLSSVNGSPPRSVSTGPKVLEYSKPEQPQA